MYVDIDIYSLEVLKHYFTAKVIVESVKLYLILQLLILSCNDEQLMWIQNFVSI
jgi:hypothetical protein